MPEIAVVLPTYNESENIQELIARIEKSLSGIDFEIVVVDDNSPDGTAEIAEKLNKKYGNVKVLKRPGKLGLGSAVLDGVKKTSAKIIAVMDSDLQHPPEVLPEMYKKVQEGNDIVIASRYVKGSKIEAWGLGRKILSKGAILISHIFLKKTRGIKDPSNGYFMFNKDILANAELNPKGFKILMEILTKCNYNSVAEIPFNYEGRKRGKSKLDSKEITTYIKYVLELSRTTH